ncbi:hypothetical protein CPB84DRAFT_1641653, partial [Gymnopilus junonius]
MMEEEIEELEASVKPVRRVLTKLRKAAHAIKNSTTIILPSEKGKPPLASRMMPRDVATHWNYTYEMLNFAYTYRAAYDEITANRDM